MPAAVRADHVTVRPAGLDDGLLTLLVRGEVGGEGEDAVEILETNHCCTVFTVQIYDFLRKKQGPLYV